MATSTTEIITSLSLFSCSMKILQWPGSMRIGTLVLIHVYFNMKWFLIGNCRCGEIIFIVILAQYGNSFLMMVTINDHIQSSLYNNISLQLIVQLL